MIITENNNYSFCNLFAKLATFLRYSRPSRNLNLLKLTTPPSFIYHLHSNHSPTLVSSPSLCLIPTPTPPPVQVTVYRAPPSLVTSKRRGGTARGLLSVNNTYLPPHSSLILSLKFFVPPNFLPRLRSVNVGRG